MPRHCSTKDGFSGSNTISDRLFPCAEESLRTSTVSPGRGATGTLKNMGSLVVRGVLVRLHGARRLTSQLGGASSSPELAAAPPVLSMQTQVAHFSASPAARAAERNYSAGLPPLDPSLLRPRTPPINYGIRIVPEKTAFVVWALHCLEFFRACWIASFTDVFVPATGGAVWAVFEDAHARPALSHTAGERLATAAASQTVSGCQ